MKHSTRRQGARVAVLGAVTAIALSACATGGPAEPELTLSEEPVTLSFTWWGNDTRHAITQEIIDAFEAEHPNITIEPQFTDWVGYWDKLSTTVAAKDTPDIIQMDEKYLSTYATNGVLMDLGELSSVLDTGDYSEAVLNSGSLDGTLYALPAGINTFSLAANKTLFDQLGIELPDDSTWTWDDFQALGEEVRAATADVHYLQGWGFNDGVLNNWLRQNDTSLYTDDGDVGVDADVLAEWWQYQLDLIADGLVPGADVLVETEGGVSESLTATNRTLLGPWWSNQIQALEEASGSEIVPLQVPTVEGSPEGTSYFKSSMYWSASASTEHPAEVATFLNYLANSEEAADLLVTERGVPANDTIREYITPSLDEVNTKVVDFLELVGETVGPPLQVTPPGGAAAETILDTHTEQVLFGTLTPEQAAQSFIAELQRALDDAK